MQYRKNNTVKPITGDEDNQFMVIASIIKNPYTSTTLAARETGRSQSSMSRIIRRHLFHIEMHQNLYGTVFQKRLDFCLWASAKVGEEADFFCNVLFTDESTFHNNGLVNLHNFHYFDTEDQHVFRTRDHQSWWSINVYGGIIGDQVIGAHFFDGQNFCDLKKNISGNCWKTFHCILDKN